MNIKSIFNMALTVGKSAVKLGEASSLPGMLLSPIARTAAMVLAVLLIAVAIYFKGHHDDHVSFEERIQRESSESIQKADAARQSATDKFNAGGLRNDGFRRD